MKVIEEHRVNPGVLVWGNHERAWRLARVIGERQPVVWACHEPPTVPVLSFPGRTIWGKELAYVRGKVGRFTVGLCGAGIEEVQVGTVVIVPYPSRPVLKDPGPGSTAGRSVLFTLMGVPRSTYRDALSIMLSVAEQSRVWVVTDDVQVGFVQGEELYTRARQAGVVFLRTTRVPLIYRAARGLERFEVRVLDSGLGREVVFEVDTVITPSWETGEDLERYRRLLGLREEHLDYYPGGTNREGILVFPDPEGFMSPEEEETVIYAVAAQVGMLAEGRIQAEQHYYIDADKCSLCLSCYRRCPHMAIEVYRDESCNNLYREACRIDTPSCRGCGLCWAECPAGAVVKPGQDGPPGGGSLVLACENAVSGALARRDDAGRYRLFPCAGAISVNEILKAVKNHKDVKEICVVACYQGKCQHEHLDQRLEARIRRVNRMFTRLGLKNRVKLLRVSAADTAGFLDGLVGDGITGEIR